MIPFARADLFFEVTPLPSARNAISSILKRLAHRNPNVQTFALEVRFSPLLDLLRWCLGFRS